MSDIAGKMAEWRKTLWGTGPCPDSSQENFTLTDEERRAVEYFAAFDRSPRERDAAAAAILRGLLERLK